jgi:hypothetical protein
VTAPGPASGLPQEAVDAAVEAIADVLAQHGRNDAHAEAAVAALTAALPLLAAERAKVAELQQAVDKVRARAQQAVDSLTWVHGGAFLALLPAVSEGAPTQGADGQAACGRCGHERRVHVQVGVCQIGCWCERFTPAAVVQPTGTAGECGHTEHLWCENHQQREGVVRDSHGMDLTPRVPCPSQSAGDPQ